MKERNIALLVEFDGTEYSGWQIQKKDKTIQGVLTKVLSRVCQEDIKVKGCSRTDAGVHALGHISQFKTRCSIPTEKFPIALNTFLPPSIVILDAKEQDASFHPILDAVEKTYRYQIWNSPCPSALQARYAAFVPTKIDLDRVQEALPYIIGKHDFKSFMATGGQVKTTIRTILDIQVSNQKEMISLVVKGDGFLYNMVRILAGTLIDIGQGKIEPDEMEKIIEACDRTKAGKTAPAHGLFLESVIYPFPVF